MQTNNILSAPLIDIIFDGRNKDYGAYELRKKYKKRMNRALLVTGLITTLTFGSVVLASSFKNESHNNLVDNGGIILKEIEEKIKPPELPEPERTRPEHEVRTQIFTEPEIVEEPATPPPSQAVLDLSKIDTETKEGQEDDGTVDPSPDNIDNGTGIIEPKAKEPEGPAAIVDIDAKFDGNWKRFLEAHLNGEVPVNNGAPAGRYSVVIRFVVDVDGSVSNIEALTAHGYGLEEEGIRVIRRSKKWEPAFLNGVHIKAYKKQVIVFEVVEE